MATKNNYDELFDAIKNPPSNTGFGMSEDNPQDEVAVNLPDEEEEWPADEVIDENERLCRICFEPGPDLISPCRCRGSSAFIHRDCLNEWRASSQNSTSYHRCNTCHFVYCVDPSSARNETTVKLKFTFWLSLDILGFLLVWQCIIFALIGLTILIDQNENRFSLFPAGWPVWGMNYCFGLLLFLFLLGIIGIVLLFTVGIKDTSTSTCWICYCGDCGGCDCNCNDCGDCDCKGDDCGDGCAIFLLVVALIIVVCGIIISVFIALSFFTYRFRRRMEETYRYENAVEDRVCDLRTIPLKERNKLNKIQPRSLHFIPEERVDLS
mmetsp:Transcript_27740/g.38596  ORF Transcript_27740/g.38596 Transcript_27740/m.38596 type:complete len:323 (-) Transcript_27740:72-1040(-)